MAQAKNFVHQMLSKTPTNKTVAYNYAKMYIFLQRIFPKPFPLNHHKFIS